MAFVQNECSVVIESGVVKVILCWTPESGAVGYNVEYHTQYTHQIFSNITWASIGGDCVSTPTFPGFDTEFTGFFRVCKIGGTWSPQIRITNENWPAAGTDYVNSPLPLVTDQWVWGAGDGPDSNGWEGQPGCCVANALATMMELLYAKRTAIHNQAFSISWIHGNRASTDYRANDQIISEALNRILNYGTLRYDALPQTYKNEYCNYPEHLYQWPYDPNYWDDWTDGDPVQNFIGTKTLVEDNQNLAPLAAQLKLASWSQLNIHASTVDDIKAAITNNGCVVFDMRVPNNFYNICGASCDGIIPLPDAYTGNLWHALPVYGWKVIGGKTYWICQPNWGDWSCGDQAGGANTAGRMYIPEDYPCINVCYVGVEGFNFPIVYLSTPTQNGFTWSIGDLSAIWDDGNYSECRLSPTSDHPAGSSDPPYSFDTRYPPQTGTDYCTESYVCTSLQPSTAYTLYGYLKAANGLWYPAGGTFGRTALETPYLLAFPSTATRIDINIVPIDKANHFYATCNGQQQDNNTGAFYWTGLTPNTQYQVTYYVTDTNGIWPASAPAEALVDTKDPTPGTPDVGNAIPGDTQVTVEWFKPSGDYVAGYQYYLDGVLKDTVNDANPITSYTFTGLTNGTEYMFKCRAYAWENSTYYYSGFSPEVAATPELSRPPFFDWTYAKWVKGDASPTLGSEKTFDGATDMYVTAAEWNALIQNVEDMYEYTGFSAYTPTMTAVISGNDMMPAEINQVKNAIGWFYYHYDPITYPTPSAGAGITDKTTNISNITYSDFNTLREKLNGIT